MNEIEKNALKRRLVEMIVEIKVEEFAGNDKEARLVGDEIFCCDVGKKLAARGRGAAGEGEKLHGISGLSSSAVPSFGG